MEFKIDKALVELVAHFVLNLFSVTATSSDETRGTVVSLPPSIKLKNDTYTIADYFTPTPKPGYIFDKWTYKDSDDEITDFFTIDKAPVELVAHFVMDPNCTPFDKIGEVRYNNVLMIKNIALETIEDVKWFRDGEVIGTELYYSAGDKHSEVLDENAEYSVKITTTAGQVLRYCIPRMKLRSTNFSSPLQAYPNPVKKGSLITIESIPKEVGSIIIYDIAGRVAARHDLTAQHNASEALPMPATEGIYLIKVGGKTLKVVVE